MGKEFDSLHYHQHPLWQSPNLNCANPSILPDQRMPDTFLPNIDSRTYMISSNGVLPGASVHENVKLGQANEPHGWFYCLPRYRQAVTPTPNPVLKERFSTFPNGAGGVTTSGVGQKRFLVFDHSGNQTSLIFNSVIGAPIQNSSYWTPKPILPEEPLKAKRDPFYQIAPVSLDGSNGNPESNEGSEMHEDTEELNALLYSDDDDDDEEEEEERSTGHSPSELTRFERQEQVHGITEEVASSGPPSKKRRLLDGESLLDTGSSGKLDGSWEEYMDDAQSSCVRGKTLGGELGSSLRGNNCMKREKIKETVSILQNIIPGGKRKNAVLVLDEAIRYLTYLKVKAKDLDAITL